MKKIFSIILCLLLLLPMTANAAFDLDKVLQETDLQTELIGYRHTLHGSYEIYTYTAFDLDYNARTEFIEVPMKRSTLEEYELDILARMLAKEYGLDYRWDKTTDINQLACAQQFLTAKQANEQTMLGQAVSGAYSVFGRSESRLWAAEYTIDHYENALIAYYGAKTLPFDPLYFNTCDRLTFSGYKKDCDYAMSFSNVGYWGKEK